MSRTRKTLRTVRIRMVRQPGWHWEQMGGEENQSESEGAPVWAPRPVNRNGTERESKQGGEDDGSMGGEGGGAHVITSGGGGTYLDTGELQVHDASHVETHTRHQQQQHQHPPEKRAT